MDFETAFKKPFTNTQRLIIGWALSILPIVDWLALGYALQTSGIGRVKRSKKLPPWKQWGELFIDGFIVVLTKLIYLLPAITLLILGAGTSLLSVGTIFMQEVMSQEAVTQNSDLLASAIQENLAQLLAPLTGLAPLFFLATLLAIIGIYLAPMAALHYARKKDLGAIFEVKRIARKAFTRKYLLAWLASFLISAALAALLGQVFIIGAAFAAFYSRVFTYTLLGQTY